MYNNGNVLSLEMENEIEDGIGLFGLWEPSPYNEELMRIR